MSTHLHRLARLGSLVILIASFNAHASDAPFLSDDVMDPEVFPHIAEEIRAEMTALDGAYVNLPGSDKRRINHALDRIARLMQSDSGRNASRIATFQYRVNSMLAPETHGTLADTNLVCYRQKRVGSNIRETECHDRGEIDEHGRVVRSVTRQKGHQDPYPYVAGETVGRPPLGSDPLRWID